MILNSPRHKSQHHVCQRHLRDHYKVTRGQINIQKDRSSNNCDKGSPNDDTGATWKCDSRSGYIVSQQNPFCGNNVMQNTYWNCITCKK